MIYVICFGYYVARLDLHGFYSWDEEGIGGKSGTGKEFFGYGFR